MTVTPLSETLSELNDLCRLFSQAELGLKQGQVTNLTGVDTRVAAVCKAVETAIPAQQQEYLPLMTMLIELLNSYEMSLHAFQGILNNPNEADHAGA